MAYSHLGLTSLRGAAASLGTMILNDFEARCPLTRAFLSVKQCVRAMLHLLHFAYFLSPTARAI